MESLRSRSGKHWLVEYNQMMDHQQQERRTPEPTSQTLSQRMTFDRRPEAAPEPPAPALSDIAFETRVEQSLARLLHRACAPDLICLGPALPLLSAAAEAAFGGPSDEHGGSTPLGGAFALTTDGRLLVLVRGEGGELGLGLNLEAGNLAQVLRGYRGLYLRLEERFAGPDGVLVLFTMDAALTDRLAAALARLSDSAVLSLEGQRAHQLTAFAGGESAVFYAVALLRSAGLRLLVTVVVTARRVVLLDERPAAIPPPLGASGDRAESFASLGSYRRSELRLPAVEETEEAGEAADAALFRFPLRVPLRPRNDRPGALDELRLAFHAAEERRGFAAALAALPEGETPAKEAPERRASPPSAGAPRQFDFERWDALSAAVKHRVAQAPCSAFPLRRLLDMDTARLAAFFARHVQPQLEPPSPPAEPEQLLAVMWAFWLHYRSRTPEALACLFLTSRAIYVVFDAPEEAAGSESLALKSLTRRHSVEEDPDSEPWTVSVFSFRLSSLSCVFVGPFNQYMRLSGSSPDQDFTLITRDFRLTENLLNYLRRLFRGSGTAASEASTPSSSDSVYRSSRPTSVEFLGGEAGGSRVEIRFPNDEILSELLYVVEEAVQPTARAQAGLSGSPHGAILDSSPSLLYYLLLENLSIDLVDYVKCCSADHLMSALILAGGGHLVLLRQNVSQYPIPDFARGPPEMPQFSVIEVRPLRCLTHVTLSSCDRRLLTLSFSANAPAALPRPVSSSSLNAAAEAPASPGLEVAPGRDISDPVHVTAYIQNPRDVDKLVKLLRTTWKEQMGANQELPVHRS